MLAVNLDRATGLALHEQVAAAIRRAVYEGEAAPGERLPPAKDIAAILGVNTNTVLRAMRSLRDEGLLEFRRGRGVTVAVDPAPGDLVERTRELIRLARRYGYTRTELVDLLNRVA